MNLEIPQHLPRGLVIVWIISANVIKVPITIDVDGRDGVFREQILSLVCVQSAHGRDV